MGVSKQRTIRRAFVGTYIQKIVTVATIRSDILVWCLGMVPQCYLEIILKTPLKCSATDYEKNQHLPMPQESLGKKYISNVLKYYTS